MPQSADLDANRLQKALTRRFLLPALPSLEAFFLDLRVGADQVLAPGATDQYGKPYPYGFCLEITKAVLARLNARETWPDSAGGRALGAFLDNGGQGRLVWGVLRDRFFQNAIQLGSLYVDVSNDTVDVSKAKVEILPMRDSGLALVRDVEHFVRIGEAYWNVRLYTNTALPSLAPAFPLIAVDSQGRIRMMAKMDYMTRLFAADGFRQAERWLRQGPLPPSAIVQALRAACPADMLAADREIGLHAALQACERLRAAGTVADEAWLKRMHALFDRAPTARIAEPKAANIVDERRSNARSGAGIGGIAA